MLIDHLCRTYNIGTDGLGYAGTVHGSNKVQPRCHHDGIAGMNGSGGYSSSNGICRIMEPINEVKEQRQYNDRKD